MATSVVCSKCGRSQEIADADQLPEGWQRSLASIFCLHCTDTDVLSVEEAGDVLAEEVIHPSGAAEDTLDEIEGFCEVCSGPCQGH